MDQGVNLHCVTKGKLCLIRFVKESILIIFRRFVFNFEIYSAQKCHSKISFNRKSCGGVEPVSLLNFILFLRERTSGIYAKCHVQIMLLFVYTTTRKRFVIFTCGYFKLS